MNPLFRLNSVSTEITMEKLDKVTNTIGEKIKNFVKYLCIILGWIVINTLVALFFNRGQSISLDTVRLIHNGMYQVSGQDLSIILVFLFENKIVYALSLIMLFVGGDMLFFVLVLGLDECKANKANTRKYAKYSQSGNDAVVNVVSYKQQVAFLS